MKAENAQEQEAQKTTGQASGVRGQESVRTPEPADRTPSSLTTIDVKIEDGPGGKLPGARFVATTPHVPELRAEHRLEHLAVNDLVEKVRRHIADHAARGEPVPWIHVAPGERAGKEVIRRRLGGCAPTADQLAGRKM